MDAQSQRYSLCIVDSSTSFTTPLPFECTILIETQVLIVYYGLSAVSLLILLYFVCRFSYARRLNLLHEIEQMSAMDSDYSNETLHVQSESSESGAIPQRQATGSQVKLNQALEEESQRKSQILGKIRSSMSQNRSLKNQNINANPKQMLYQSVEHTSQDRDQEKQLDSTVIQDDASQHSHTEKQFLLTSSNNTKEPGNSSRSKPQNTIEMQAQRRNPYQSNQDYDEDLDTNHNVTQDFIQKVLLHDNSDSILLSK